MPTEKMEKRTDRRKKIRFPIHRELRYKLLEEGVLVGAGTGQSVNIGSGGVAISIDRELTPGAFIELSISWPVLLDDSCPMRFIVFGRVLRSLGRKSACTIDKYEFRTQARTMQAAPAVRNDQMLERWAYTMRKEAVKPRVATA
ncbi:MAG TPA: hypothetical protein VGZ73_13590 [Bryobacteraceae bacterium]|jgi:hypothetical protein|nr:hypothetical protein [Bryobacteraceae bacterium]